VLFKAKNLVLIACNKDLFWPKIMIFLLNMLWEICCHIIRKTKNCKFKKFRSPTDEIYKETSGSGRGTHIPQFFALDTLDCFSKNIIFFVYSQKAEKYVPRPLPGVSL
jgi:hypothetical protein